MSVKLLKNIAHLSRNKFKLVIACICLTTFIIGYKYVDFNNTANDRSKSYARQQDEAVTVKQEKRLNGYAIYGNRGAKKNESKQNIIDLGSIDFRPFAIKDTAVKPNVKEKVPVNKEPSRITESILPVSKVEGVVNNLVYKPDKSIKLDLPVPVANKDDKVNQNSNQKALNKNQTQLISSKNSFRIIKWLLKVHDLLVRF